MNQLNRRTFLLIVLDFIIIALSYFFAFIIRFDFVLNSDNAIYLNAIINNFILIYLIQILTFKFFGVMRSLWKYMSIEEVVKITISVILSTVFSYILITVLELNSIPRSIYIIAAILSIFGMVGIRAIYRFLRIKKKSYQKKGNALIIGAGDAGYLLAKEIMTNDKYGEKIVGFIDDNKSKRRRTIGGIRILGSCDDLSFLQKNIMLI